LLYATEEPIVIRIDYGSKRLVGILQHWAWKAPGQCVKRSNTIPVRYIVDVEGRVLLRALHTALEEVIENTVGAADRPLVGGGVGKPESGL
jgi:hypothetical protein